MDVVEAILQAFGDVEDVALDSLLNPGLGQNISNGAGGDDPRPLFKLDADRLITDAKLLGDLAASYTDVGQPVDLLLLI